MPDFIVNPFVSEAQRRYLWLKHPGIARRWAKHTPKGKKLPKHKKPTTNAVKSTGSWLLRADPTQTTGLRRAFYVMLRRQFARIAYEVVKKITEEDVFGIRPKKNHPLFNREDWQFESAEDKAKRFRQWFRDLILFYLFGAVMQQRWEAFIVEGYQRGASQSYDDVRRVPTLQMDEALRFRGSKEEFLRALFTASDFTGRIKQQVDRTANEVYGLVDRLTTEGSRAVSEGLATDEDNIEVAREINRVVAKEAERSVLIVDMELVRSYVDAQIIALERLNVDEVGVMVEWVTRRDRKVCPICRALEGVIIPLEEARGMFPRHPRCRCRLKPVQITNNAHRRQPQGKVTNAQQSASVARSSEEPYYDALRAFGRIIEGGSSGRGT